MTEEEKRLSMQIFDQKPFFAVSEIKRKKLQPKVERFVITEKQPKATDKKIG